MPVELDFVAEDPDAQFFQQHRDRQALIRAPRRGLQRNSQRAVRYLHECELEFRSLGPHDPKRRRIIVWRAPADHPTHPNHLLKIPFLAFADEEIADRDDVLLPIVHEIMRGAAQ